MRCPEIFFLGHFFCLKYELICYIVWTELLRCARNNEERVVAMTN